MKITGLAEKTGAAPTEVFGNVQTGLQLPVVLTQMTSQACLEGFEFGRKGVVQAVEADQLVHGLAGWQLDDSIPANLLEGDFQGKVEFALQPPPPDDRSDSGRWSKTPAGWRGR